MSLLSAALVEAVAKLYPVVGLTRFARFLPMNELDSGEFSSTAAIEVARVLKQGAAEIAERIIAEISREVPATWRHDNGYIVCSGLSMPVLLAEGVPSIQAALKLLGSEDEGSGAYLRGVLCLIPDSTEPIYARIRLVARSVIQALLAVEFQGPITVCLNPLDPLRVGNKSELIELFRRAVEYIFKHPGEARVEVPLPRGAVWDGAGVVSIWSSHHYHERLSKATRAELANGRKGGAWQLTMPADAWLLCRDRALLEILEAPYLGRVIERLESDDDWLIFLFHCASTMPSGDFDPAVALFEECSSPLWSLRVLIERFGRFARRVPLPTPLASLACCSTDHLGGDRELFIRSLAMPFYAARSIALSDLEGWCGAIERLAKGGHAFINSPSIRLALEKGGLDGRQSEIAASLGFGLSCIMNIVMEN